MSRLEGPECNECDHTEGQHDTGAYEVGRAHYGPCEQVGCDCELFTIGGGSRTKEGSTDSLTAPTSYIEDEGDPYARAAVRPRINGYWEDPLDCDELGRW